MAKGRSIPEEIFVDWANRYLRTYYKRVVAQWGEPDLDASMWQKLMQLAGEYGLDINFYNMDQFKVANLAQVSVSANNVYGKLRPLLEEMYLAEMEESPENVQSLAEIPYEDIEVTIKPSVSQSRLANNNFSKDVEKLLFNSKHVWLTAEKICAKLKITLSDWEDLVDKRNDIIVRESKKSPGIQYYALKTRVEMPKFGTDDFKKYVLKIFESDDEKFWKSNQYIASQCFMEEKVEKITDWLYTLPELVCRVSKNDEGKYYFCPCDKIGILKEENQNGEGKNAGKNKGKNTGKNKRNVKVVEWMMYSQFHVVVDQYIRILHHYAAKVAARDVNILSHFTSAEKSLMGGLSLLKNELKVDDKNLPELKI